MGLRGELYYAAAWLLGAEWRARLQEIETSPAGEIERRALPALLDHAVKHVPYYRDLGISEPRLDAFPLLSRQTLRSDYERLKSDDLATRQWKRSTTGGSTGEPVWVLHDRSFLKWDYAADLHYLNVLHGISPHEYFSSRRALIWHQRRRVGAARWKQRGINLLGQLITIEPYSALTAAQLDEYVRRLNRHRPAIILTFAGTAFQIARHAKRKNLRLHKPRLIISSVEMLYPPMRAVIEEVFGCPVRNMYGSAEVGRVAAECSAGKFHLLSFVNHIEVLDDDSAPTAPGKIGRVVITALHNHAMPLIRYEIGDLAQVSSEPCTCGSPLPTIDTITGRTLHHFVRPDGSLVFGGTFVAMFYEHEWISGMHVLQEDINRVVVQYRRTPGHEIPSADIEALSRYVRNAMGNDCSVVWEEVEALPTSAIGKHQHVRSLVWEDQLASEGKL